MRAISTTLTLAALLGLLTIPAPVRADESCEYPRVLIVLDHSDSMARTLEGSTDSLWAATLAAIRQLVTSYEDSVAFGLMVFPDPVANGCAPGAVLIPPAPAMADEILDALENDIPAPDPAIDAFTPIKQTFDALVANPGLWGASSRNHVLFITDGEQYCACPAEDNSECTPDPARPADLLALGVPSFIMGLSTQTNSCFMARMAMYGGTARPECPFEGPSFSCNNPWDPAVPHPEKACYYQADDAGQMTSALDSIARQLTDEQCDGLDNDCDGLTDEDLVESCETPHCPGERRCEAGVWGACAPLAVSDESCNDADDDCDGETDEDLWQPCFSDCGEGQERCVAGQWVDCSAAQPRDEECGNLLDDDCDGDTDEGCDCAPGERQVCGQSDTGKCQRGEQLCGPDGLWQACQGNVDPVEEVCNDADDDCDGDTDEALTRPCASDCGVGAESCSGGAWGDCDAPVPGEESCNGLDDDCDGETDEALTRPCASACGEGVESCVEGDWAACDAPASFEESCNGIDDDCDGETDEEAPCPEGQSCQDGLCKPTQPGGGLPLDETRASAEGCQAGGASAPAALLLLLLALGLFVRRRRA